MDIPGSGKTQSIVGLPDSSYDNMDATGTVASGTDGADGSGGFDGTARGVATAYSSSATPGSRSHGNSPPHVPLLAASSPSLLLVLPTRTDLETVKRTMMREEPSSDEGSTADEGVPDKGSGRVGSGPPMRVGVGYTARVRRSGKP